MYPLYIDNTGIAYPAEQFDFQISKFRRQKLLTN